MCREGGGKGSPGVITLMNPGPYWPLYLWGFHLGGSQTIRPLPRGGSSRPKVTRLVRYGPVRQKKNFSRRRSASGSSVSHLVAAVRRRALHTSHTA
jgi:hypothetical protein